MEWNVRAHQKHQAWQQCTGLSVADAQHAYVTIVMQCAARHADQCATLRALHHQCRALLENFRNSSDGDIGNVVAPVDDTSR
jgi:hypothetical protein